MNTVTKPEDEVAEVLADKDAEFLERFVCKILELSTAHWAKKTVEAHSNAEGAVAYSSSFDEWHRLRMNSLRVAEEIERKLNRLTEDPSWELTADTDTSEETGSEKG